MRRITAVLAALLAVALTACGAPPSVKRACPEALDGQGTMGGCLPAKPQVTPQATTAPAGVESVADLGIEPSLLLGARAASASAGGLTFPDFSNNDPCYCGAQLKAHGHAGEIDKANQGTGFLDRTFAPMVKDAYAHGLAVGGYDFDQLYTADETYTFVRQLEAAGIHKNTPRTFPPTLDVEFGLASRTGLEHQLAVLFRTYGRAQIYTGAWYWLPHFGCWTPPHVTFWLSGYPIASLLCSLSPSLWLSHQFTDHGYTGAGAVPFADMSVFRGTSSQWASYVRAGKPKPTKRQLEEKLWHLYRVRAGEKAHIAKLSKLMTKHGCRPPHHATPKSYHRRACPTWKAEGDADHAVLRRLPAEITRAKARIAPKVKVGAHASSVGISDRLTTTKASIEVLTEPVGTKNLHIAVMSNLAGAGLKYLTVASTARVYTPPPGFPVVDVQAYGTKGAIGGWVGRLQTVPGGVKPPPVEEPKTAPMIVAVDTGGWGGGLLTELISAGIGEFRVQQAAAAGVPAGHIASIIYGAGGTIGNLNPDGYATEVVGGALKYHPGAVEVLNEPGGSWFWSDPTNYKAYANLAAVTHEALQVIPVSSRPVELCSWDGGQGGSDTFGQGIKAASALSSCDGVTVHPYGGAAGQHGGAAGDRQNIERAHVESGKPVYVTEAGWPTAIGQAPTGDSQQWTEAQQASNITSFIAWAKSTGYVRMVVIFDAVDYGSNDFYGIETSTRKHKPSFAALAAAAK